MKKFYILITLIGIIITLSAFSERSLSISRSTGQTVYVPATFVKFFYGSPEPGGQPRKETTATRLIIRNLDRKNTLRLISVDYYDPTGTLVKQYIDNEVQIAPFHSVTYLASQGELGITPFPVEGGRPFFLVKWSSIAGKRISQPIIESARLITGPDTSGQWGTLALDVTPGTVIE